MKLSTDEYLSHFGKMTFNQNFHNNLFLMPSCTEKTIIELLEHFEHRPVEDCTSTKEEKFISRRLVELQEQIHRQELYSEEVQVHFSDLSGGPG